MDKVHKNGGKRRLIYSCDWCRKRKVKCDQGNPCDRCLKANRECLRTGSVEPTVHPSPKPAPNLDSQSVINELRRHLLLLSGKVDRLEKGLEDDIMLFDDDHGSDDEYNLAKEYENLSYNGPNDKTTFGLLAWKSSIKFDSILNEVWEHNSKLFANEVNQEFDIKWDSMLSVPGNMDSFSNGFDDGQHDRINVNFHSLLPFISKACKLNKIGNIKRFQRSLTEAFKWYDVKAARKLSLLENSLLKQDFLNLVRSSLPKHALIWELIDHFFQNLYPSYPILNEMEFKADVQKLLGEKIDQMTDVQLLLVEENLDFANLGILLIVLCFSIASLQLADTKFSENTNSFSNTKSYEVELSVLLDSVSLLQYFQLANVCLNQFNLLDSIDLKVYQLLLISRMYQTVGLEFGDGPDDGVTQAYNAVMMQLAHSLALHMDSQNEDQATRNLRSNLWYHSCVIDFNTSLSLGAPQNVIKFNYNVPLPSVTEGDLSYNCLDPNIEVFSLKMIQFFNSLTVKINRFYRLVNSTKPVKLRRAYKLINGFYSTVFNNYPAFTSIINSYKDDGPSQTMKWVRTYNLKFNLWGTYLALSMYVHFYHHLCRLGKPHKAMQYLMKAFEVVCRFLRVMSNVLLDPSQTAEYSKMVNLWLFLAISQKALFLCLGTLLRLQVSQMNSTELYFLVKKLANFFVDFFKALAPMSYQSWRFLKVFELLSRKEGVEYLGQLEVGNDFGFNEHNMLIMSRALYKAILEFEGILSFQSSMTGEPEAIVDPVAADELWLALDGAKANKKDYSISDLYKELIS